MRRLPDMATMWMGELVMDPLSANRTTSRTIGAFRGGLQQHATEPAAAMVVIDREAEHPPRTIVCRCGEALAHE